MKATETEVAAQGLPPLLARLHPAWFALVMATGIVSVATQLEDIPLVPDILLWTAGVAYAVLWVLLIARMVRHTRAFVADLGDHLRGMGFFTVVAATAVLGGAALIVGDRPAAAKGLWLVALVLWMVLVYVVPVAQMLREPKPEISEGITGTWLVWIVATQGVSVLGTQVASEFGSQAQNVMLLTLCLWLLGIVVYIWVTTMILTRLFFGTLESRELSPTYWITMGAAAISTVAGSFLVLEAPGYAITADLVPFLRGMTVLVWATATWWIPWLVIMGVWRHIVRRYPLWFDPGFWAMVFPLGMYTVATFKLSQALEYPPLADISAVFVWIALAAWVLTFGDMVVTLSRRPLPANAI